MSNNLKTQLKKIIPKKAFSTLEPSWHLLEAAVSNARYGAPARGMHIIGVTGTNGKTTTCVMIHKMLVEAGYKAGLMTTVCYGIGREITPQAAHVTTASGPELQKKLAEFKRKGVEWVVLETTSHALAQHRVWGVPYEIAVMTNVTHEHLDYHGTFERYVQAKLRLFQVAARHGCKLGIVNYDDPSAPRFLEAVPRSLSYGIVGGDLKAEQVQLSSTGSKYTVIHDSNKYNITCNIPGEFNVYNSIAVVAVGIELGLSKEQIEKGIASVDSVEGRMNTVDVGQKFSALIDFAHTPDSFERLLKDIRKTTKGKLVVLFGSAGRRDESKRAIQGEIAGRYADEIVLTEEDDRDVDGNEILEQIAEGAMRAGKVKDKDMFLILDRIKAIQFAVSRVKTAQDTVVFLGKGHEKTIERADGEHPWDEIKTVRAAIGKR